MKGVVLREVGVKVVVVAPAYRFAFYPSAFPFLEGHYFGKVFLWEIDAESVVVGLGTCVCGLSCGGEARINAGEEVCMRVVRGGAMVIRSGVGVASVEEAFLCCGGESDHCFWGTFKNGVFKFSAAKEYAASEGGNEGRARHVCDVLFA